MNKTQLADNSNRVTTDHTGVEPGVYRDDIDDDSKFRPHTLWDGPQKKLVIYIMEGVGIVPPEGGIQIRLRYEPSKGQKLKHKTTAQYSEDPRWNELVYFDLSTAIEGCNADELAKTSLMMEFVSVKKNAVLGEAALCVPTELPEEQVFDAWIDFKRTLGKGDLGTVHVRALYSSQPETVAQNWDWRGIRFDQNRYMYLAMKDKVKTGDLICYDSVGTLAALTKVVTNSMYSRMGLIFEAPSKYSRSNEFYVLEVTRNRDKFQDAFKEARIKGVNVFRLWDRIHQVPATKIWWAPLAAPLPTGGALKLREWIWDLHDPATHKASIYHQTAPASLAAFLDSKEKFESEIGELFSARLILQALAAAGVKVPPSTADLYTPPIAVMTRQLYEEPILIRAVSERRDTVSIHADLEAQSINNPMVSPKPKLEVMRAETPIKASPANPDKRATTAEDKKLSFNEDQKDDKEAAVVNPKGDKEKTSPRFDKEKAKLTRISEIKRDPTIKKDDEKDDKKEEKKKDDKKDEKKDEPDLVSPRATLMRVVSHRKRERKEKEDQPSDGAAPTPSPSLVELAGTKSLKALANTLSENKEEKLSLTEFTEKLKEAAFNDSDAVASVFHNLRRYENRHAKSNTGGDDAKEKSDSSDKVTSARLGNALTIALTWMFPEDHIDVRLSKALDVFAAAHAKSITKKELESFLLSFFYLGGAILAQVTSTPLIEGLSAEAVKSDISDPLFDEEWETFSSITNAEEGDSGVTDSIFSSLGKSKSSSHKRMTSMGEPLRLLPQERVIKWFKRENDIDLLTHIERELASAQLALINASHAALVPAASIKSPRGKEKDEEKERKKKEKEEKKEKEAKEAAEAKEKAKKEKEKEKEERKRESGLVSPRATLSKRPTIQRDPNLDIKTKLNPAIIEVACSYIESHLDTEGIFRVGGGARNVDRLFRAIIEPASDFSISAEEDPSDVASAFKQYLRQLEPPLIPFELFDEALTLATAESKDVAKAFLANMPKENCKVLERIVRLLTLIALRCAENKMDANNLAIVFGPTLIRPAPERDNPAFLLESNEKSKLVVVYLMNNCVDLFAA